MLSFANAPGNIFNILGKCGLLVKNASSYQGTQKTGLIDPTNGLIAQLFAYPDIEASVGNQYQGILNTAGDSAGGLAATIAQQSLNRAVFLDNPRISQDLNTLNIDQSILELIRQMKLAGASVLAMTVTGTPTAFTSFASNTGNGVVNVSVKRPYDGLVLENTYAETVLFTCISDSYTGGAVAGNETFQLTGTGSQTDFFAFNWPLGSNVSVQLAAIDGNTSNGSGNLLTNSGFESFTSNSPNNWVLGPGSAGIQFFQETGLIYDGLSALRILGDGTTASQLEQQFNSSAGTAGTLAPYTQYSFNIFMRRDGTAAGAGQLTIDICDQNGVTIKDANGVANSFIIDLTQLTVNYQSFLGVFRTPAILPSQQFMRMRLTTPLTNGRSVYMDKASLGVMTQHAVSCPFYAVHAGSTPFLLTDYTTAVITNSRGSGGTLSTFQTLMPRLFPSWLSNEFLLPSSASPTIADTLIG